MIENNINIGAKSIDIKTEIEKGIEKTDISHTRVAKNDKQNISENAIKDTIDIHNNKSNTVNSDILVKNSSTNSNTESVLIGKILENIFDKNFAVKVLDNIENKNIQKLEMKVFEVDFGAYKAEGIITTVQKGDLQFELKYRIVNEIQDEKQIDVKNLNIISDIKNKEIKSNINFYAKEIKSNDSQLDIIGNIKFSNTSDNVDKINRENIINLYLKSEHTNKVDNFL